MSRRPDVSMLAPSGATRHFLGDPGKELQDGQEWGRKACLHAKETADEKF